MPERPFVFVADDAAFPYGAWEAEALSARLVDLMGAFLDRWQPDAVVIACNTASTIAIKALRDAYPQHRFVGTVPAIKPAAERTASGLVSVLATPGTVRRDYTHDLIAAYAGRCDVTLVGSETLAGLAETYLSGGFVDEAAVAEAISPCFVQEDGRRTDIVVLACTHYPFLANRMRKLAPWPVDWIDPAEAIARRAATVLADISVPERKLPAPEPAFFTAGEPDAQRVSLLKGFGLMALPS